MKTKKTFKSVIAMLLAVILSFGAMSSAFAANVGDVIDWPVREEYEGVHEYTNEYTYKGELKEGSNAVENEGEDEYGYCYTFEAAEAGIYLFECKHSDVEVSAKVADGAPANIAENIYSYDVVRDGDDRGTYINRLVYIPQGTAFVGVDCYDYSEPKQAEIAIEYIGGELADVKFAEDAFTDLVMDYDYYGRNYLYMTKDVTLVFADGSEYELENAELTFVSKDTLVEGENIIETRNLFGIEKQYTMTCVSLDSVIEKVEISNLDKYLKAYRYYHPTDIDYAFYGSEDDENGIQGETLTVTFTDGTKQSFVLDWDEEVAVELESGAKVYLYVANNYHFEDEKAYLEIETLNGDILLKKECEIIEVSDKQNLERLGENLSNALSWLAWDFEYWIGVIMNPADYPYYTTAEALMNLVDEVFSDIDRIFSEIRDCCEHLILG